MESLNEIQPNLKCEKCYCTNIGVVKKGFSGFNAVLSYIITSVLGGFIIGWAYSQNDIGLLYKCYCFVAVLVMLSFFVGTVNMNDKYTICLRCAHKTLLQTDEEKNATPWYESRQQRD